MKTKVRNYNKRYLLVKDVNKSKAKEIGIRLKCYIKLLESK
jgi:hypothetical protein